MYQYTLVQQTQTNATLIISILSKAAMVYQKFVTYSRMMLGVVVLYIN